MRVAIFSVLMMVSSVSAFAEAPVCLDFSKSGNFNYLDIWTGGKMKLNVIIVPLNEKVSDLIAELPKSGVQLCVKGNHIPPNRYYVYDAYVSSPKTPPPIYNKKL